jgi:hypothetical protein
MKDSKHISKSTGFKVPRSYFENFKVKTESIDMTQNKSGFVVPDAYFEDFKVETPKPVKVRKLNETYKTIAVAASLLAILGTLLVGLIQTKQETSLNFSKLNHSDIENYLEYEMMMEDDLYVEEENVNFNFNKDNIKDNTIIEDLDDSSLEQLMDY